PHRRAGCRSAAEVLDGWAPTGAAIHCCGPGSRAAPEHHAAGADAGQPSPPLTTPANHASVSPFLAPPDRVHHPPPRPKAGRRDRASLYPGLCVVATAPELSDRVAEDRAEHRHTVTHPAHRARQID